MVVALPTYVLVTAVKNEAKFLEQTLISVVHQSCKPIEWVIVNDGSTDGTEALIDKYTLKFPWIRKVNRNAHSGHSFASVVFALEEGISSVACHYDCLGILDADVRLCPDYFKSVLEQFACDSSLGIAGGVVFDVGVREQMPRNRNDVPGAVQMFSRRCLADVRPLVPVPEGGWDAITCVTARMMGYRTRLFVELEVEHLKPRNVSQGGAWKRWWQLGKRDYVLGYHPFFEFIKCSSRAFDRRCGLLAAAQWVSFCWALCRRRPRITAREVVTYLRAEQMGRVTEVFRRWLGTEKAC